MEFKEQMDVWLKKGTAAVQKGAELTRDKVDTTRRILELKKQLKGYQSMLDSAYMEIGKCVVSAREENREILEIDNWLEQVRTAREMIGHLERQLAQLQQIL